MRYLRLSEQQTQRFLLQEGDVLISRGNGTKALVGLAAIVSHIDRITIFPDTAFRVRLNTGNANPDWFTLIWNAPQVRRQIEAAAKTTAGIWKVSQADLAEIELLLPSIEEQNEIVRVIGAAFLCIDRLMLETTNSMKLLSRLDQAVFAKAFCGKLATLAAAPTAAARAAE